MDVIKQICNRVAVMEHGEVVECGDVFNIFANPQHELTKAFIKTTSNLSKVEDMLRDGVPGITPDPVRCLQDFPMCKEMFLSRLSRQRQESLIST